MLKVRTKRPITKPVFCLTPSDPLGTNLSTEATTQNLGLFSLAFAYLFPNMYVYATTF